MPPLHQLPGLLLQLESQSAKYTALAKQALKQKKKVRVERRISLVLAVHCASTRYVHAPSFDRTFVVLARTG